MQDFIFALNRVLPIVLLILLGFSLKKIKLISKSTLDNLNKVCFRVFLPISLFKSVYSAESLSGFNFKLIGFIVGALVTIFLITIILVIIFVKDNRQKGAVLQAMVRPNYAYIGIPLAVSIAGDAGEQLAAIVALVSIPIFNIFAVIALSVFVDTGEKKSIKQVLLKIAKNPLIHGVLIGMLCLVIRAIFVELNINFRLTDISFLYEAISKVAGAASPIALITLGGLFEFKEIKRVGKQLTATIISRQLIIPLILFTIAYFLFDFNGAEYAVLIAVFGAPVAVSSAVMAKEMGSDEELANQIVVWTTISSSLTIFLLIFIFRLLSIF